MSTCADDLSHARAQAAGSEWRRRRDETGLARCRHALWIRRKLSLSRVAELVVRARSSHPPDQQDSPDPLTSPGGATLKGRSALAGGPSSLLSQRYTTPSVK